jgi:L-threonylcarbamoyladenylate synthase
MVLPERVNLADLDVGDTADLADRIAEARLVCFPTDTVYGVGGSVSAQVGEALLLAKGRAPEKPLQVIFATLAQLEAAVPMAPRLRAACRELLPGPLTLVVPYPAGWTFPPSAATLGVRVPAWPPAAAALAALPFPLVASSANRSGRPAPASLDEVDPDVLGWCDLVLDVGRVSGVASTVLDLSGFAATGEWRVLREGAVGETEAATRLARVAASGQP